MDSDERPDEVVMHRADVEVLMLLVSPAHRYGVRAGHRPLRRRRA